MKDPTVTRCVALLVALLSAMAFGQSSVTSRQTKDVSQTVQITKFFVAEPAVGSGYETGPLHIIYSDGTEIVQTLPSLKPSTDKEIVFNAVGFSGVELAQDRQTVGWTINVQNCCASYSIPLSVVVFQHKQVLHTFDQGQLVWSWMFVEGGMQVAVAFGPTHGPEVGDYRLYDVITGKLVSEVWGDADTQSLKTGAPDWAKRLQYRLHNRRVARALSDFELRPSGFAAQPARDALLQDLHNGRRRSLGRLTDDVSEERETMAVAHFAENLREQAFGASGRK